MPPSTVGSSTLHVPTYCHSSSVFSFLAFDVFHRLSQSSVNCSRKGALRVVGWEQRQQMRPGWSGDGVGRTVNVGLSTAEEVTDSTTDATELETSSTSSATSPRQTAA